MIQAKSTQMTQLLTQNIDSFHSRKNLKTNRLNPKIKSIRFLKKWITYRVLMTLNRRKFVNSTRKNVKHTAMWSECTTRFQILTRNYLCKILSLKKRRIEMLKRLSFWKEGYKLLQKMLRLKNPKEKDQNLFLSKSISRVDHLPKCLGFPKRSLKNQAARSL